MRANIDFKQLFERVPRVAQIIERLSLSRDVTRVVCTVAGDECCTCLLGSCSWDGT